MIINDKSSQVRCFTTYENKSSTLGLFVSSELEAEKAFLSKIAVNICHNRYALLAPFQRELVLVFAHGAFQP